MKYDDDIPPGHPSEEKRNLKPRDTLLRAHGFKIKGRPKSGGSVWTRAGDTYTEREALEIAQQEAQK